MLSEDPLVLSEDPLIKVKHILQQCKSALKSGPAIIIGGFKVGK